MPRKLNPAFIEEVKSLSAKGYNQTQIATKLNTSQPRISFVLRKHGTAQGSPDTYANMRRHALIADQTGLRIFVHISSRDGTVTVKEQKDATPDQLRALADYVDGLREQAAQRARVA